MERPLPGGTAFLITVKPLVQVSMTYHPTFAILEFCQSTRLLTKYWYGFLQRKLLQFGTSKVGFHKDQSFAVSWSSIGVYVQAIG